MRHQGTKLPPARARTARLRLHQSNRQPGPERPPRNPKPLHAAANNHNVIDCQSVLRRAIRTRLIKPPRSNTSVIASSSFMSNPTDSSPIISWEPGGTPRSVHFDDPYYSREDGRAETHHVFLTGNSLPARWPTKNRFTIAELGFGTGLNLFETLHQWHLHCGEPPDPGIGPNPGLNPFNATHLTYISFEIHPLSSADIRRAMAPWPDLAAHVDAVLDHWPPPASATHHVIALPTVTIELHLGDASLTVPAWHGAADAWYLDGFSPAKNPELWNSALMDAVHSHTVPGGTFATYTVAGSVRRNLANAGFEIARMPGFGRKRESLRGHRPA